MKQEHIAQALRDLAIWRRTISASPIQGDPEDLTPAEREHNRRYWAELEEPCPYCRSGWSHTSELCKRYGGQG